MASGVRSTQQQLSSRKAKYLVVFRHRSEKNLSTLSRCLKFGATDELRALSSDGMQVFERSIPGAARVKMFTRAAVAAADLTPEEKAQLQNEGDVQMVVRNEVRYVPPFIDAGSAMLPAGATGATPGFQPGLPIPGDPRAAYLLGYRDALDMITQRALLPLPAGPAALAASMARHSWCLDMVGVPAAYARATGKRAKVAVLDTGLDLTHPDFRNAIVEGVNARSFVDGESVQDLHGHGTHCCGVVAGPPASSVGRYGVAPDCELFVGKVLSNSGRGYDDDILEGITWAAEQGARVISMSLGASRMVGQPFPAQYQRVAEQLLNEQPGVLIVAAAGNESNRPASTAPVGNPASCPSIMAVAAVDKQRIVAPFSCKQMDSIGKIEVSAPGVAVVSAWTGGGYRSISGTSMATPHVAGLAALYLEVSPPAMAAVALGKLLVQNAQAVGHPEDCGAGIAQAPR